VFLLIDSQNLRLGAYCTNYLINLDTIKLPVAGQQRVVSGNSIDL